MNNEEGGQMDQKELDLDELDQAVTQMMRQGKSGSRRQKIKPALPPSSPDETSQTAATLSTPDPVVSQGTSTSVVQPAWEPPRTSPIVATPESTEPFDTQVVESTPPVESLPSEPSTPTQPLVIPQRPRGVAMDIVPSKSASFAPPSARPSRTAATLKPSTPVVSDITPPAVRPKPAPVASEQAASEVPTIEPAPIAPPESPESTEVDEKLLALPDPQPLLATPDASAEIPPASPTTSAPVAWPDPLAVHGFEETSSDQPAESTAKLDFSESQSTSAPASEHIAYTPLHNATPFVAAKVEKRPLGAFTPATPPEESTPVSEHPADFASTPSPQVNPSEEAEHITPQEHHVWGNFGHHESTGTVQEADRPIFDTTQYHPPIQPNQMRHKPKLDILFVVVTIILLIAAGVMAYFIVKDMPKFW